MFRLVDAPGIRKRTNPRYPKIDELRPKVLEYIRVHQPSVEFIISSALKVDRKLVQGVLKNLVKEGKIEEVRRGDAQSRCFQIKG